ncbi:hypothetical protein BDQ17DRAFT_1411687 [Cyathus striatus]|nr:hypothetical protein BDQ17DRAFT_1411687 [Cyathus striatus]
MANNTLKHLLFASYCDLLSSNHALRLIFTIDPPLQIRIVTWIAFLLAWELYAEYYLRKGEGYYSGGDEEGVEAVGGGVNGADSCDRRPSRLAVLGSSVFDEASECELGSIRRTPPKPVAKLLAPPTILSIVPKLELKSSFNLLPHDKYILPSHFLYPDACGTLNEDDGIEIESP